MSATGAGFTGSAATHKNLNAAFPHFATGEYIQCGIPCWVHSVTKDAATLTLADFFNPSSIAFIYSCRIISKGNVCAFARNYEAWRRDCCGVCGSQFCWSRWRYQHRSVFGVSTQWLFLAARISCTHSSFFCSLLHPKRNRAVPEGGAGILHKEEHGLGLYERCGSYSRVWFVMLKNFDLLTFVLIISKKRSMKNGNWLKEVVLKVTIARE